MTEQTEVDAWLGPATTPKEATEPEWKRESGVHIDVRETYQPNGTQDYDVEELKQPPGHCQRCGAHLQEQFRRVFGDENDICWACIHCPDRNKEGFVGSANPAASGRETRTPRLNSPDKK